MENSDMRKPWIAVLASLFALPGGWAQGSSKEQAQKKVHRAYLNTYHRGWFAKADKNDDGYLTLAEYSAAEKALKGTTYAARFRHADKNKDRLVSREEAKAQKLWEIEHHTAIEKEALEELLETIEESDADLYADLLENYDADNDGTFNVTEVRHVVVALGKPKSELLVDGNSDGQIDAVERLRKWVDADHDGTIESAEIKRAKAADLNDDHKVDRKERRLWRKKTADLNNDRTVDATERSIAAKKAADRNKDGTVDAKEKGLAWKRRADRNRDGKVGPVERKRAVKVTRKRAKRRK